MIYKLPLSAVIYALNAVEDASMPDFVLPEATVPLVDNKTITEIARVNYLSSNFVKECIPTMLKVRNENFVPVSDNNHLIDAVPDTKLGFSELSRISHDIRLSVTQVPDIQVLFTQFKIEFHPIAVSSTDTQQGLT